MPKLDEQKKKKVDKSPLGVEMILDDDKAGMTICYQQYDLVDRAAPSMGITSKKAIKDNLTEEQNKGVTSKDNQDRPNGFKNLFQKLVKKDTNPILEENTDSKKEKVLNSAVPFTVKSDDSNKEVAQTTKRHFQEIENNRLESPKDLVSDTIKKENVKIDQSKKKTNLKPDTVPEAINTKHVSIIPQMELRKEPQVYPGKEAVSKNIGNRVPKLKQPPKSPDLIPEAKEPLTKDIKKEEFIKHDPFDDHLTDEKEKMKEDLQLESREGEITFISDKLSMFYLENELFQSKKFKNFLKADLNSLKLSDIPGVGRTVQNFRNEGVNGVQDVYNLYKTGGFKDWKGFACHLTSHFKLPKNSACECAMAITRRIREDDAL
ncbi:hypothetical protein ACOME3_003410 [Neoechinorhynchus agilis]